MERGPYLIRLGARLTSGLRTMSAERKARHRDFILAQHMSDGGFRGREGAGDLYYTSFAVRALLMLEDFPAAAADGVASFLASHPLRTLNVIDLLNWMATALAVQMATGRNLLTAEPESFADELAVKLESVRTSDGGYAKSPAGAAGSTYHSFLTLLTYQLLGKSPPRPQSLVQFLYDRQRDDGGFVEIAPMRRSGTNPTAAAVAMLRELGQVSDELRADIAGFLREVQSTDGGFQANTRVPFADSLSTFTAVLTAQDLELPDAYDERDIRHWLESQLEFPTGGFRAATWDNSADVEYTFYSLGLLALLSAMAK